VRQGEYSLPRLMPHKGDSVIEARRILARQSVFDSETIENPASSPSTREEFAAWLISPPEHEV